MRRSLLLVVVRVILWGAIVYRALRVRIIGGIAHLEVVMHPGHAGNAFDNRLRQLPRGVARHRPRQRNLALDRRGRDQIVLQSLGSVQCMHHVHLDLAIGALTRRRRILCGR